jgi:CubicO group peptidase (beta-lactamase class C family)
VDLRDRAEDTDEVPGELRPGWDAALEHLTAAVRDRAMPGATFGLLSRGALNVGAVGRFTYAPESTAVQTSTRYDLASLTKVLATTAMAMLLWQRGRLELDMPLAELLPGFVIGQTDSRSRARVTLRMLLEHTSGMAEYARLYERHSTKAELFAAVLREPLVRLPGTAAAYSDLGFILLGKALEVVAAEPLDRFCHREIFAPLGMKATGFGPVAVERPTIPPTERDEGFRCCTVQGVVHDENCFVLGGVAGHAGLFGNAGDVLRFAGAMLTGLKGDGASLFEAETIRLFTLRNTQPTGTIRALGWDTPGDEHSSAGSTFLPGSFGHLGFTGTSIWGDPTRELAVVLLTNRTFPTRDNKKIQVVRPLFHDALLQGIEMSIWQAGSTD